MSSYIPPAPRLPASLSTAQRQAAAYYKVFCLLDTDKDGLIGCEDIANTLDKVEAMSGTKGSAKLSRAELEETLKIMSRFSPQPRSNAVDFPTFFNWVTRTATAVILQKTRQEKTGTCETCERCKISLMSRERWRTNFQKYFPF